MPADATQCSPPLITRLVKFWSKMKSLLSLAAVMAVINSCLLCCCGPLTPFVLQVVANMSLAYWGFHCCSAANQRDSSLSAWPSEACLWFCPNLTLLLPRPPPPHLPLLRTVDPIRPLPAEQAGHIQGATESSAMGPQGLSDLPCRRFVSSFLELLCVCAVCKRA